MSIASAFVLFASAAAVAMAAGYAYVKFVVARLPQSVHDAAEDNGRFSGLGTEVVLPESTETGHRVPSLGAGRPAFGAA